jgi:hypothetical protein
MTAGRELAQLSEDTRFRDLRDGTIEVVTMQNGPVERYHVYADGTSVLLEREPRTRADKWSLRLACGGSCLVWLVGSAIAGALAASESWYAVPVVVALAFLAVGEGLARHSWGDVERYLERREGGSEGWNRLAGSVRARTHNGRSR